MFRGSLKSDQYANISRLELEFFDIFLNFHLYFISLYDLGEVNTLSRPNLATFKSSSFLKDKIKMIFMQTNPAIDHRSS